MWMLSLCTRGVEFCKGCGCWRAIVAAVWSWAWCNFRAATIADPQLRFARTPPPISLFLVLQWGAVARPDTLGIQSYNGPEARTLGLCPATSPPYTPQHAMSLTALSLVFPLCYRGELSPAPTPWASRVTFPRCARWVYVLPPPPPTHTHTPSPPPNTHPHTNTNTHCHSRLSPLASLVLCMCSGEQWPAPTPWASRATAPKCAPLVCALPRPTASAQLRK